MHAALKPCFGLRYFEIEEYIASKQLHMFPTITGRKNCVQNTRKLLFALVVWDALFWTKINSNVLIFVDVLEKFEFKKYSKTWGILI